MLLEEQHNTYVDILHGVRQMVGSGSQDEGFVELLDSIT